MSGSTARDFPGRGGLGRGAAGSHPQIISTCRVSASQVPRKRHPDSSATLPGTGPAAVCAELFLVCLGTDSDDGGQRGAWVEGTPGGEERLCAPVPCPSGTVRCLGVFGGARYAARVHGPPAPCCRRAVRSQSVSDVRRPRRATLKPRLVRRRGEERTHGGSGRCSEPGAGGALGAAVPGNFAGRPEALAKG